ncbi:MAG: hypothetical protein AAF411_23275, partial [Myxococcota bacterium]
MRNTILLLPLLLACASDGFGKADARALQASEPDRDFCAEFAWYGDGECDDFCLSEDVDCGDAPDCRPTGCSGQICADGDLASTCEFLPEYACYQDLGICERQDDGACGWTETPELSECLNDPVPKPEPGECRRTGCSGELCAGEDLASACIALPEFACYGDFGVCERQDDGACGWTDSVELSECLSDPEPEPEPGECFPTGCSGQLCADESIATTCEFLPEYACYQELGICERQDDGACGWTDSVELSECL